MERKMNRVTSDMIRPCCWRKQRPFGSSPSLLKTKCRSRRRKRIQEGCADESISRPKAFFKNEIGEFEFVRECAME